MKKKSIASKKGRAAKSDTTVSVFEAVDLGDAIRAARSTRVVHPKSMPTSIWLEQDLLALIKEKAAKKGLGYQTMLKMVVRDHIHEY